MLKLILRLLYSVFQARQALILENAHPVAPNELLAAETRMIGEPESLELDAG